MIAIRTMFAAAMALMVAGSTAQSSSSSTGSWLSSSSAMPNDSSSSSIWILSSSSTGSDGPSFLPYGTYIIGYGIDLSTGVLSPLLDGALVKDIAATIAANAEFQTTASVIEPYIRSAVNAPFTVPSTDRFAVNAVNTTATAWILGNITDVLVVDTLRLAETFAFAARNASVIQTESSVYGAHIFQQDVSIELAPTDSSTGFNGASSAASASLLVGTMIAALAMVL